LLDHYGIRGPSLSWFKSYLYHRFQYTVINGEQSSLKCIITGVPQGSILGPWLYLLYVNDIFSIQNGTKCVLYADDTTLIVSASSLCTLINIAKNAFSDYSQWFSANYLALNAKKTKCLIFGSHLTAGIDCSNLSFDCYTVQRFDYVTYLGIILDDKLSWCYHINAVHGKLAKGLGLLKLSRRFLPKECLHMIYNAYILPYLLYCIELWGNACSTYVHPIKVVQKNVFD